MHLTVHCDMNDIEVFKEICKSINCKAIIIDLTNGENQVMTSKTIKVNTEELYDIIVKDVAKLSKLFKVSRIKIETSPFNGIIGIVKSKYIETHLPCINISRDAIDSMNLSHDYHISKNYFKKDVRMITTRVNDTDYLKFRDTLRSDISILQREAFLREDYIEDIEICILDTNPTIDNNWMKI